MFLLWFAVRFASINRDTQTFLCTLVKVEGL